MFKKSNEDRSKKYDMSYPSKNQGVAVERQESGKKNIYSIMEQRIERAPIQRLEPLIGPEGGDQGARGQIRTVFS